MSKMASDSEGLRLLVWRDALEPLDRDGRKWLPIRKGYDTTN